MMTLHPGAALYLAQAPASVTQAFEYVDADADAVMLERRLEDGGHGRIRHQGSGPVCRFGMPPPLLCDRHARGKQQLRLAADLETYVRRGSGSGSVTGRRLVHQQPQPPQALLAGDVA